MGGTGRVLRVCLILVATLPHFIESYNPCEGVEAVVALPLDWLAIELSIAVVPSSPVSFAVFFHICSARTRTITIDYTKIPVLTLYQGQFPK